MEREDKEGKVPKELYNHYTVITYAEGTYGQVANASYFKEAVSAIVAAFDRWIAGRCFDALNSSPLNHHPSKQVSPIQMMLLTGLANAPEWKFDAVG